MDEEPGPRGCRGALHGLRASLSCMHLHLAHAYTHSLAPTHPLPPAQGASWRLSLRPFARSAESQFSMLESIGTFSSRRTRQNVHLLCTMPHCGAATDAAQPPVPLLLVPMGVLLVKCELCVEVWAACLCMQSKLSYAHEGFTCSCSLEGVSPM